VLEEVTAVALQSVLHPELHAEAVRRSDLREDRGDDSVLAVLGILTPLDEGNAPLEERKIGERFLGQAVPRECDPCTEPAAEPVEGFSCTLMEAMRSDMEVRST